MPSEPGLRLMVTREPIGVVAAFTPWNAPVFTPCRKIGSVLAAGCALILKGALLLQLGLRLKAVDRARDGRPIVLVEQERGVPGHFGQTRHLAAQHWLAAGRTAHLLISFHGIPERYVQQGDPYFLRCQTTARLLGRALRRRSTARAAGVPSWPMASGTAS